ncbi:uncharacterized protein [Typha latifolia]|uniref:uncharacterized protein n=1 Tax=Typha latifolia TaxID=4733 RepID=UPI003C2C9AEC
MTQAQVDDGKLFLESVSYSSSRPAFPQPSSCASLKRRNVFRLLAWREISPRADRCSKSLWGGTSNNGADLTGLNFETTDAKHALFSWVESESLRNLSAKYCPLLPPPRSTIAAAFSSDGKKLASTHGDHTVKIIDCQTGNCLKVLSGHRRTPWVVRFHPLHSEILVSGSLDHEVRLWDALRANCIGSHDFYRPIASIAFHAQGELLAVASGHKLFIWDYNRRGEASSPMIVLKTRRSLRAVHFHPLAAPFLLTAEINNLDSSDSPLTHATSSGYLHYPLPFVFFANPNLNRRHPSERSGRDYGFNNGKERAESLTQHRTSSDGRNQHDRLANSLEDPSGSNMITENAGPSSFRPEMATTTPDAQYRPGANAAPVTCPSTTFDSSELQLLLRNVDGEQIDQLIPFSGPSCWELPFLQGWLVSQSNAGSRSAIPVNTTVQGNSSHHRGTGSDYWTENVEDLMSSSSMVTAISISRATRRSNLHQLSRFHPGASVGSGEGSFRSTQNDEAENRFGSRAVDSELPTSLAATGASEIPCTVKLRIWPHDVEDPCASLNPETCRLTISHAVLCSEMGAHFSPCGRFLVACVACLLPHTEDDPGVQSQVQHHVTVSSTSPTRHPLSSHKVIYELRIYSLEEATFGKVLASRVIKAAHCLTSIQFSPTSEHILLAYGRRQSSLLRSIVFEGETAIHIYTILEVYRVSDMALVKVLPSAKDEVNVACFHPLAGGGLVYGTKEGKLRILQYDGSPDTSC